MFKSKKLFVTFKISNSFPHLITYRLHPPQGYHYGFGIITWGYFKTSRQLRALINKSLVSGVGGHHIKCLLIIGWIKYRERTSDVPTLKSQLRHLDPVYH